ncbi:HIT family protein [Spirillospora sp. NPDC047279]|uniref:HIT family protein n=1 Tax=Spirillospora sp. NPDC047279 TaxID=3155478 RepID=UPI00340FD173
MDECPFCLIAAGRSETEPVYADDHTVSFVPLRPAAPGHLLVIPRTHVADLWDLDGETSHHLTDSVLRVAHAVRRALRPDGLNVINSSGRAASQTVFHLHVHLVPRWEDDDFGDIWPRSPDHPAGTIAHAAERVRAALRSIT